MGIESTEGESGLRESPSVSWGHPKVLSQLSAVLQGLQQGKGMSCAIPR